MTPPIPVFDGHNDVLLRVFDDPLSFLRRGDAGHIDLPRAREGGLAGGFCAMFTRYGAAHDGPSKTLPPSPEQSSALQNTIAMFSRLLLIERESHGQVQIVRTADQIERCLDEGVFAAIAHVEGAEPIDRDLNALEVLHGAGLRSLGPVWSRRNDFGEGVPFMFFRSPDTGPGLTAAGRELIQACNRLGILVDLSHITEAGFWDVASISDAPLVATHSNAHALSPATRNLTDRQLDAVRESDGMVGVNFCVGFLREDCGPDADTPLDTIVRHVDYLVERIGIDRVGFGSDFDGTVVPIEMGDATGLPRLLDALRGHGYDKVALRKVAHENWIRVLRRTWHE